MADIPKYDENDPNKPKVAVDPKGNEPIRSDDPPKPIQIEAKDEVEMLIKQEDLVKRYVDEFVKWESWRRPYENLWNEIYRLYLSVIQSFKTPTRAKIFIPVVFQVIEAAIPKLLNVIVAQREFFECIPDDVDDEPIAERIKKLVLYQLDRARFFVKFVDFLKQLLLYGTSYFYCYWKVKREWVWTRTPIRKDVTFLGFRLGSRIIGWDEKKEYAVIERRPEVEFVDALDVFPDPEAGNEEQAKGLWHRSWVDIDDLKELGQGKYPLYANTESPDLSGGAMASFSQSRQVRWSARTVSDPTVDSKRKVEILSRWGRCDLDGDGIKEETLLVIANRRVLLKAGPNPFHHQKRPIIRSVLFPVPGEWFGIGLIEPVVPLQHELNTVRRQRLDNINLILNRMWKVSTLADVDMETLISCPSGVVLTDDMDAVEALETPDVTQGSYNDAAMIQQDIENVTAPRSVQGIPENGRLGRTARGAQLIITQALEKFGTSARLTEETAIKELLEMWHQLNMQFIDEDDTLRNPRLYGGLFDPNVTVEDIRANVKFRLTGSSELIDKEGKINQLVSFFGMFKEFMTPGAVTLVMQKVWKLMGFEEKEIDRVEGQQPQAVPPPVAPQTAAQNAAASVEGQVARNGAAAPISAPGARPPAGV